MGKITNLFTTALKDFRKNPVIIFPTVALLIFFILFSKLSIKINYSLKSGIALESWLAIFVVISLAVTSYFLSGLIGMSKESIKKRTAVKDFFSYSKKFWLRNLAVMIVILIVYTAISLISQFGALGIGRALELPLSTATVIFYLLYFAGLVGILIFLTFASFYLVVYNLSIKQSLKKSISFVKSNYLDVLTILVVFFILGQLVNFIGEIDIRIVELINAVFLVPYFSLVLTRFILKK